MIFDGRAVVANTGDDTLSFIDLTARKVFDVMDLGKKNSVRDDMGFIGPYDILYGNDGYLYCTNVYDNSIFKIDLKNKQIEDLLYVGRFPTCIESYLDNIIVLNSDSNSISIIDKKTFALVEGITVGEKPVDMEVDREQIELYIVNSNSRSISIVDLIGSKRKLIRLEYSPIKIILEDEYIYILSIIDNGRDNMSNISIMDRRRYRIQESMDFDGIFNSMLKINSGELVFITGISDGYLYRMDMRKCSMLSKTYLEGMPNRLEWDGANILLITNLSTDRLILFDIVANKIIDSIKVGKGPSGVLTFS
ncbi:MAG TPA: hypothetical protein GXX70_08725 [Tepidimicrobium sp.]|nr:hypothetical protein [Tepidimicrobium sp.]